MTSSLALGRGLILGALVAVVACGSDAENAAGGEDRVEAVPFPSTIMVDEATAAALTAAPADGTLRFRGAPPGLAAVESGKVIIAPPTPAAPFGLMRFVGERKVEGADVVLRTVAVPPQVAFRKLHVQAKQRSVDAFGTQPWTQSDLTPKSLRPRDSATLGGAQSIDFYPYNADNDTSTTQDQVHVHGELAGSIKYDFGMDVDWGDILDLPSAVADCFKNLIAGKSCSVEDLLPEIKVGYGISADAKGLLRIEGAAFKGFEKEYTLAKITAAPIAIGPLVFFPELEVAATVKGQASSRFDIGATAIFHAGAGISFSSKNGIDVQPPNESHSFETPAAQATLGASASVGLGPKLAIKLYDFAGPYASLLAGAEISADTSRTPCFDLSGRGDLNLGFHIGLDLPVLGSIDLVDVKKGFPLFKSTIASGACALPPGASSLPPGAGPDAAHFQTPTYTPWSHTLDKSVFEFGFTGASLHWTDTNQTIDGNYVVTGPGTRLVSKWNDAGKLIWAKSYRDPSRAPDTLELQMGRTVALGDTALLATAEPFVLLKLGQSGGVYSATRFDVEQGQQGGPYGSDAKQRKFMGVAEDGSGGAFVAGSFTPKGGAATQTWILHVNVHGEVVWSKRFIAANAHIYPQALVALDGGVLVTGLDWDASGLFRGWVARIDNAGSVAWAKRLRGPAGIDELEPTTAIRMNNGNIAIAGRMGTYQRSFLASLKSDGTLVWKSSPWTGSALSYMVIDSLAELPTTGFVAAGHYAKGTEPFQTFTAGLDAIGQMQWLRGYKVDSLTPSEGKFASMSLTDDGGLFIASHSSIEGRSSLWVMKPTARDGALTLAAPGKRDETLPFANGESNLREEPLAISVEEQQAPQTKLDIAVVDAKPSVLKQ